MGEGVSGARLEVSLEPDGERFSPELDADIGDPWSPRCRGPILSCIVGREADDQVRRHADVAASRITRAPDDVDKSLGWVSHAGTEANVGPEVPLADFAT